MSQCNCNHDLYTSAGGGLRAGGSASSHDSIVRGGIRAGGSATVDVPTRPFDAFLAVWPLNEEGVGTTGEYTDATGRGRTGTGGGGNSDQCPDPAPGLLCTYCQEFTNRDFILFQDPGLTGAFTISLWVKSSSRFQTRGLYSSDNVRVRRDWLGLPEAEVTLAGGAEDSVTAGLIERRAEGWSHFAATYDLSALRVYVNGVLQRERKIEGGALALGGQVTLARGFEGWLQEVRVMPEAKPAEWLAAEYASICGSLVGLGDEMDSIVG